MIARHRSATETAVVVEVDNRAVLRHAFEEARMRGVPLRVISAHFAEASDDVGDGNRLAQAQLSRRLARWTRSYPDVQVESAVVRGRFCRNLGANTEPGQLFVTDSHAAKDGRAIYQTGCSLLTVRCGNM